MELLEIALKHSITWSIETRRNNDRSGYGSLNQMSSLDALELANAQTQDESHIRAFLSHFKIELNNLMDLNQINPGRQSPSDSDSVNSDNPSTSKSEGNYVPVIMINGRHSGLYEIHRGRSDGSTQPSSGNGRTRRSRSIGAVVIDETSGREEENSDVDDGYRSLSRGSFRSSLMQKLNDIRARLMDLVDEIDQNIESRLTCDQVEAYRKRKTALVGKLDSLIDSCLDKLHKSTSNLMENLLESDLTSDSATENKTYTSCDSLIPSRGSPIQDSLVTLVKNKSEVNLCSDGYEDQIMVIDFDRRRSSDTGNHRSKQNMNERANINVPNFLVSSREPIDFGAMMKDYESKGSKAMDTSNCNQQVSSGTSEQKGLNRTQHHANSSSATSSFSNSSHASSSSYL